MDVRLYFKKIRALAQELPEENVIVTSCATSDGGRAGRLMELTRDLAAQMIVDGRVRLATDEERAEYRETVEQEQERRRAQEYQPQRSFLIDLATVRKSVSPVKGKKG